jgi:hypothetical protein
MDLLLLPPKGTRPKSIAVVFTLSMDPFTVIDALAVVASIDDPDESDITMLEILVLKEPGSVLEFKSNEKRSPSPTEIVDPFTENNITLNVVSSTMLVDIENPSALEVSM